MKRLALVAILLVAVAPAAAQAPVPTAEHEQLTVLVGAWKMAGTFLGGTVSGELTCDRFPGGFHVVCRGRYDLAKDGSSRTYDEIGIWGYDPEERAYSWQGANSLGWTPLGGIRGRRDPNGWTWTHETREAGKPVTYRWVFLETTGRISVKGETSTAAGAPEVFVDSVLTRVK